MSNKHSGATIDTTLFWQSYCNTCGKQLCNWTNERKVAEQTQDNHLRNNPNHSVTINTK